MDWWNDLTDWISSDDGWRVLSGAIIPFVAIVVAGVIAALIGRGATKRVVAMQEREGRNAAVAAVISAARKAAAWGSLGHDERAYADHLAEDADIRLRLLPVTGAPLAANWTQHEIADIKKNSSTFSFQAEQSLAEFRDRLLEWQARPSKARKLFKNDLERWKFDSPDPDAQLIARQQDWNADQVDGSGSTETTASTTTTPAERPTPTTTSLRPALRPGGTPSAATSAGSGTGSAPSSAPASPAAAPAAPSGAGFSVTRGGAASTDPNATTPISDDGATRSYGDDDGATRSYGDDARPTADDASTTRAYGDGETQTLGSAGPVRPTLGSPMSPGPQAGTDSAPGRTATGSASSAPTSDRPISGAVPPPVATPTSADAHVNRSTDADRSGSGRGSDSARATTTTSIPTRITGAPAEPTDANETAEAPYTQPISANELRRRAADDDE